MPSVPIIGAKGKRPFDYCLVTPYAHQDPRIMHARAVAASKMAAHMMVKAEGSVFIVCPVVYVHSMLMANRATQVLGTAWEYYGTVFLDLCDALLVLRQPGWESAPDVQGPIARAKEFAMDVVHADPPAGLLVDPAHMETAERTKRAARNN